MVVAERLDGADYSAGFKAIAIFIVDCGRNFSADGFSLLATMQIRLVGGSKVLTFQRDTESSRAKDASYGLAERDVYYDVIDVLVQEHFRSHFGFKGSMKAAVLAGYGVSEHSDCGKAIYSGCRIINSR